MQVDFYYHRVPVKVEDMTQEQLGEELDSLQQWFNKCARTGQGISTKEFIRHNDCRLALIKKVFGEGADIKRLEEFFSPAK